MQPGAVIRLPTEIQVAGDTYAPEWGLLHHSDAAGYVTVFVPSRVPPFTFLDGAIFGLGVTLLALGILVLLKSADAVAGWAFWRLSLCVGASLALVPAGSRGVLWVLVAQFVALRLSGPLILALAWILPAHPGTQRHLPVGFWLPAVFLLMIYPACWWWPQLYAAVSVGDGVVLLGYLTGTVLLLGWRWWAVRGKQAEQAQFALILLGLVGGFAPFLLLTVLPSLVVGQSIVTFEVSILPLLLLPLSVAVAIARSEFLGITSLIHRQPLRVLVGGMLLAGCGFGAVALWQRLVSLEGWPPYVAGVLSMMVGALGFNLLYPRLIAALEHVLLRDAYDPARAVLEVSVALAEATSVEALATGVVERLCALLDLSSAWLVGLTDTAHFHHPRGRMPPALEAMVLDRAWRMLGVAETVDLRVEQIEHVPVLFVPVAAASTTPGAPPQLVLCLGPKRSGDRFSARDRAVLRTLAHQITVLLHTRALHHELDTRIDELEYLSAERTALAERLIVVAERERHELAAVLHDDALQLVGQVERLLGDAAAEGGLGGVAGMLLGEAVHLSREVSMRLRAVVSALHPPPLEMAGLVPALQGLLRDSERAGQVCCVLAIDPSFSDERLPPRVEQALYQIAREGLTNTLRHAAAQTVQVEVRRDTDIVRLVVRDDGCGFEPQRLSDWLMAGHLGLALLHERAQEIGGHATITSTPGEGTVLTITVPSPARQQTQRAGTPAHKRKEPRHADADRARG